MKSSLRIKVLLFLVFISIQVDGYSQGFLRANGQKIVNDKGEVLLRGIGLGGWMLQEPYMLKLSGVVNTQSQLKAKVKELIGDDRTATFYNAWLSNHMRKADVDSIAKWGFNSIRLPMHYNLFTLPIEQEPIIGQNTWLDKGFILTDNLLKWCKANHIYLILDLHAAPGAQGTDYAIADGDKTKPSLWESEANQQKTIALWKKLATRYANEPWIGGYDLINETNYGFSNPQGDLHGTGEKLNVPLKQLLTDITSAIRSVDKKHLIFLEGNGWANNYNGFFPLWDNNLCISFHKYWNFNDQNSIKNFISMREKYNIPLWMGESGENSNVWIEDAIALFEKNDIGWALWPLRKIGLNNPFQITLNPGYQKIIDFWKGNGEKPSAEEAFKALMQLTEDVKAENTFPHTDYIDALFRQQRTDQTKPYKETKIDAKAIIFAANYDLGRNGFAYYDKDTADFHVATNKQGKGNSGGVYRNDGVDIIPCTDAITNGYCVTSFETDEWMKYTVNVKAEGSYSLSLRVAADNANGKIMLLLNNQTLENGFSIPETGGITKWQSVSLQPIQLLKGINTIIVKAAGGGFNINYLELSKITATKK
jgi:endoglucanase